MTNTQFSSLAVTKEMLKTIASIGYEHMTPIQAQALPHILDKTDVIAQAKTGSGKTAAFGIGVIESLRPDLSHIQGLILCPTRELAEQVTTELRRLARFIPNVRILTLTGGRAFRQQSSSLEHGSHIIVGTPGRVLDHIQRETIDLKNIATLVLDEADRMLDMGFEESLTQITKNLPKARHTMLFSATYPPEIIALCKSLLTKPKEVRIDSIPDNNVISQVFYNVDGHKRPNTLLGLFQHYKPRSSIVFCNTKAKCNEIVAFLKDQGIYAVALHGDMLQKDRTQILVQFAHKSCSVLVATDVAARGLDVESVDIVINYELAEARTHMHRIGRTGRAGKIGIALSLYSPREQHKLEAIETYQKGSLDCRTPDALNRKKPFELKPAMCTLCINGGKKQKLRPGDILGALTGEVGLQGEQVGKIDIKDYYTYVAVDKNLAKDTCNKLMHTKIKNRKFKVNLVSM